ncbi:Xylose operon regulatory protein [Caulifigura coniformis]|uniref:Xylose operon regulatory protein n=1 Tax=Caulifigura coniformis TaxID=2527983 RepID=A0A517SMY6_9PLAN|nr:DNA-binding transcriptional regulator [Caulifigura coniformis]QDT57485.1 Xylose operon regulatory protein [Caulifigura coniformis]
MARTRRRKNVALLVESSNRYARELLHGIHSFIRERFSWSIQLTEQGRGQLPVAWLKNWSGDGIIARIETEEIAEAVRAKKVPTVNVSATGLMPEAVSVISDSRLAMQLAVDHLLERGLKTLAFCGDARFPWAHSHAQNFQQHADARGAACFLFPVNVEDAHHPDRERTRLAAWLKKLPKPVGVAACYDVRGQQLLEICRELGLQVPEQVAVIGWHNDELLCDLCDPPMSSVIPSARRAGYEAAQILDDLMAGKFIEPGTRMIAPLGVATRQSTDVVAVNDPHVAAAVRFIRDHACDGITVSDVVQAAGTSRTLLERSYKKALGSTIHDDILNVRIDRVKRLLAETDLSLRVIAERTGFEYPEYLSVAFRKRTGISARDFRLEAKG